MPFYLGSQKIKDIYVGSTKIGKVYKGSELVYQSKLPAGQVIFESATPGTYTITIPTTQTFHIDLVGGGGGGYDAFGTVKTGGSGAYIYGNLLIEKGTYTLIIGSGGNGGKPGGGNNTDGEDSLLLNNVAGKGYCSNKGYNDGAGGTATVVSVGLTGQNGITGSTTGWINGYGAGGYGANSGRAGYCKIVAV